MSDESKDNFLAALAANYEKPAEVKEPPKVIAVNAEPEKLVQVGVVKKRSNKKASEAPPKKLDMTPGPTARASRHVDKLDAQGFINAIRDAGMRAGKRDENLRKSDEQDAMNHYEGYRFGEPHGTQLDNSLRKAKTVLRPSGPLRASVAPSVAGYIKGCPDGKAKKLADLEGRVRLAIEATCEYQKIINNSLSSDNEKVRAENFIALESERIKNYNKEILALG